MARAPDITKAIEAAVVRAVRAEVSGTLRRLNTQVAKLGEDVKGLAQATARSRGGASARPARVRKGPVSKARRLHGRYIGLLRHLPKKDQARVKLVRKNEGVEPAIRAAEQAKKAPA